MLLVMVVVETIDSPYMSKTVVPKNVKVTRARAREILDLPSSAMDAEARIS